MKDKQSPELKKEKIKRTAFLLIAKKGIDNTSMSDIAAACGVTKPVLYYYFKDKEDLIYNLVAEKTFETNSKLRAFLKEDNSFEKFCIFAFKEYLGLSGKNPREVLCFIAHISSYTYSHKDFEKRISPIKNLISDVLFEAVEKEYKQGHITAKNKEIAKHLILAVIAHLVLHNQENGLRFTESYPKDMVKTLLKAIDYKGSK